MREVGSSIYYYKSLSNEKFLEIVMLNFSNDVLRLAYSYVKNKEVAEDITQTVFIKCYKQKEPSLSNRDG